jgi:hypothetical protein
MKKSDYRCFLYKQVEGKTVTNIYSGANAKELETAVDKALTEGWHTTFADFIDDVPDINDDKKAQLKDACSIAAGDANILANAHRIEDIDKLRDAYERINGKPLHKQITSLKGVRKAIKKALGDSNVNK